MTSLHTSIWEVQHLEHEKGKGKRVLVHVARRDVEDALRVTGIGFENTVHELTVEGVLASVLMNMVDCESTVVRTASGPGGRSSTSRRACARFGSQCFFSLASRSRRGAARWATPRRRV